MSLRDEYAVTGPAGASRALGAAWLDLAAGGVVAMLAFPFPFVRRAITEALPGAWVAAFVGTVLAAFALGGAVYLVVTAAAFGRTPGMYLLDLGFEGGRPSSGRAAAWAFGVLLSALPALAVRALADPTGGVAALLSGLRVASTSLRPS